MSPSTLIQDMFAYNDWANNKLLTLSAGLSDAQLDAEQPMGLGSLRATLYHMAFAERIWLDRWLSKPWTALSQESAGTSLATLAETFDSVSKERNALLELESDNNFSRMIDYANSAREPFHHRLRELLVHVVNHATHHRAQALNFLRPWGRKVTGGLDYLFFKLACPTIASDSESVAALQQHGLELGTRLSPAPSFDADVIRRYCEYGNWAMDIVLPMAQSLPDADLDRTFEMGQGSLRKALHHICEAEQWWYLNWTEGPAPFGKLEDALPIGDFLNTWQQTAARRDQWLAPKTSADLADQVTATPGGARIHFRLGESILQLCGHGTHHRAQAINMLRRLGQKLPATDYVVWVRGVGAPVD